MRVYARQGLWRRRQGAPEKVLNTAGFDAGIANKAVLPRLGYTNRAFHGSKGCKMFLFSREAASALRTQVLPVPINCIGPTFCQCHCRFPATLCFLANREVTLPVLFLSALSRCLFSYPVK